MRVVSKLGKTLGVVLPGFVLSMLLAGVSLAQPTSLIGVPIPEPPNLAEFVKNKAAAIRLGKALFWDMQVGSDGVQACASCHFHAGADNRSKNQLSPGLLATPEDITFQIAGPNATLLPNHFPNIVRNDVVSSQGVFNRSFVNITPGNSVDVCNPAHDPKGFTVGGINVRRVEPRNTPTTINSVFNFHNFWDGRADNTFNGSTPRGAGAGDTPIFQNIGGALTNVSATIAITNASLASQAVGPPRSEFEMSCAGRTFPDIGKKMLSPGLTPLGKQRVHPNDSVLGLLARSRVDSLNKGLSVTYGQMIQDAFVNSWWDSTQPVSIGNQTYSQMEANFSLFFGLAVHLYEATLISDQTPFDFFDPVTNPNALTPQQQNGLAVFNGTGVGGNGRCLQCHSGPVMSNAGNPDPLIDPLNDGFQDIGVRPTSDDLGAGPIFGAGLPDFNATFKVPLLRNVELTAPYFHNGSALTLKDVVEFYDRGGNFPGNINVPNGQIRPLLLTPQEKDDLVAFLKSLTDERVRFQVGPFDHPSLCIPDGHPGDDLSVSESAPGSGEAADALRCIRTIGQGGSPTALRTFPVQPLFEDVTFAKNQIEEIAEAAITAGCGPGIFCPDSPVTRAQMAVFIETALGVMTPPACRGNVFADVTAASVGAAFCGFIEDFASRGITGGCRRDDPLTPEINEALFCPGNPVPREQMAVFIETALGHSANTCSGRFDDVPATHGFCGFIERLAEDGITGGCTATKFCPDDIVTRAQMAVFLATAFLF